MMIIADLMSSVTKPLLTLPPDARLADALVTMARMKATAAVIIEHGRPCGILTRGDCLRKLAASGLSGGLPDTLLRDVMSTELTTADPEKTLQQAIDQMSAAGIEHLPVLDAGRVAAVLDLNDLLERQIVLLDAEVTQLQNYIETLHLAGED